MLLLDKMLLLFGWGLKLCSGSVVVLFSMLKRILCCKRKILTMNLYDNPRTSVHLFSFSLLPINSFVTDILRFEFLNDFVHRYVVELMGMIVEFIQNLDVKIKMVRAIPTTEDSLSSLVML